MMRMVIDEKQGKGPMDPVISRPLSPPPPPPPQEEEVEEDEPMTAGAYQAVVKGLVKMAQNAVYNSRLSAALHPAAANVHDRLAQQVRVLSQELVRAAEWMACAEEDLALCEDEVAYLREELAYAWSTASSPSAFDDDDDDLSSLEDGENESSESESALEWWQSQGELAALEPLDGATSRALEEVLARSVETLSEVDDEPLTLSDLDEEMEAQSKIGFLALMMSAIFGKMPPCVNETDGVIENANAEVRGAKVKIVAKARAAEEETRPVEPAEMSDPALAVAFPSAVAEGEAAAKAETTMRATTKMAPPEAKKLKARQIVPPKIFPSAIARRPLGTLAHAKVAPVTPAPAARAAPPPEGASKAVAAPVRTTQAAGKTAKTTKAVQQPSAAARAPIQKKVVAMATATAATAKAVATVSAAVTVNMTAAPTPRTKPAKAAATKTATKKKNEKPPTKAPAAARLWR